MMKDEALDDTHTHVWEQLITLMEREIQLLGDFTAAAGEMRESLHRKDWSSLEAALVQMDAAASHLAAVESERTGVIDSMEGSDGPEHSERRIAALPPELRRRFNRTRAELRARITAVRSRTRGLAAYAESRSRLGREIMNELSPDAEGRLYDRQGARTLGDAPPMLLSRHL